MKIQVNQTLQLSWPQVHEISQKWTALIFFNFHEPWKSSKIRQFNFLQFSWFLGNNLGKMTPGTWNFTKFQTLWLSSTFMTQGVHENLQKSDDSNFTKNQTFWFYSIFKKIEAYDFCGFSCKRKSLKIRRLNFLQFLWPRTHESWRKLNFLIFEDFHVPGVIKIECSDFWAFSCTRGHENWIEVKRLIFVDFPVPWAMKIE